MFEPCFEAFAKTYDAQLPALVSTRLVADLETPVSAFLKLSAGRRNGLFLLESVEGGAARGRYSMIGLDPDIIWRCYGDRAEINRHALTEPETFTPCPAAPLEALRALIAESRIAVTEDMPPMAAGVFGYLGYDMVRLDGNTGAGQTRSDRRSRRDHVAADDHGRVRQRQGRNLGPRAGAARRRRDGARRL